MTKQPSAKPQRPETTSARWWLGSALILLVAITFGTVVCSVSHHVDPTTPTLAVVSSNPPSREPPSAEPFGTVDADARRRIAASEYGAAQPPPGGVGIADARPAPVPAQTIVQDEATGGVTGFKLRGTGPAFYEAGFADGDILVSINSEPAAALAASQAREMLRPGAMIEIDRNGERRAWRMGGKAE